MEMSLALSTTWMLTSIEMLHQLVARLLIQLWYFLQQLSALTMPTTLVTLLGTSRLGRTNSQGWCRLVITSRRNRRNNLEISRVAALNQHRRDYHDPDELPSDLAGQTADSTGETTLPPIRPLLDLADAQAQHRVLPPGHLRDTPNNWVPERDISYGHRMARLEALRFEIAFHELDYTLYCLHHDLQRHLCERCEGCRMQFGPLRPP